MDVEKLKPPISERLAVANLYCDSGHSSHDSAVPPQCEVCAEAVVAYRCAQCVQWMCKSCKALHSRYRQTAQHTVLTLGEAWRAQQIQQVIVHMEETQRQITDEIKNAERKEESVKTSMATTLQEIKSFALAVQTRCDELQRLVEETGQSALAPLQVKLEEFEQMKESIGTGMEKLIAMLESDKEDEGGSSVKETLKPFMEECLSVTELLTGDNNTDFNIAFKSPNKEQILAELSLKTNDEKLDIGTNNIESENNTESANTDAESSDYEEMPDEGVVFGKLASCSYKPGNNENNVMPSFRQFAKQTLKELGNMTNYSTLSFSIINSELWLLSATDIRVYDESLRLKRSIQIVVISSKKQGRNPRACAQNRIGYVFVAFDRLPRDSRHETLNGIWLIHPVGHAVAKLASGGYVDITCSDNDVLGLRSDLNHVTIHRHAGGGIFDWTTSIIPLDMDNPQSSLLASADAFYLVSDEGILVYNRRGDLLKLHRFPSVKVNKDGDGKAHWRISCVDTGGNIIACEQVSGCVRICDTVTGTFLPIHFRQEGVGLDNPIQVLSDFKDNLYAFEQTSYGDEVSKFALS